jgi:hypothetical protein
MKRSITLVILLALALPGRVFAIFGIGDIVFDPSAYVQLIQAYEQGGMQLSTLGNIVGLNTQQLDTLKTINTAVGIVNGSIDPKQLTMGQLASLSQGLGVDASGAISQIYQSAGPFAGALDVFMGTSIDSFRSLQSAPWSAYANFSIDTSLGSIGVSVGMGDDEVQYTKTVGKMDAATRAQNRSQISSGLASLSSSRYSKDAERRRLAIQAEANLSHQAATRASSATTLNETAAAGNELAASRARLEAIAASNANQANESLVIQGDNTNALLQEMNDRRAREDAEKRLNQSQQGNAY